MKKTYILISCLLFTSLAFAQTVQNSPKKSKAKTTSSKESVKAGKADNMVTIKGTLENCSTQDSFLLYQSFGYFKEPMMTVHPDADGNFTFKLPPTKSPEFYFVGLNTDADKLKPVIVTNEHEITLNGPCYNMTMTSAKGSKINEDYDAARRRMGALKIDMNQTTEKYQANYNDPKLRALLEGDILKIDKKKLALLDSLKKANPFIAKIIALDTYTSFQESPKKANFKDEIDYFATQYFQYVDWKDAEYNNIPFIYEMFRSYAQVILLPQLNLTKAQQKAYCENLLKAIPAKSLAYKYAVCGLFSMMIEKQNPLLIDFCENYIQEFPKDNPEYKRILYMIMNQMKSMMVDVPAPEIAQEDTTGKVRKLSDLKGKYVLIDFWASWCGPCRRENPNVVKLYNQYKSKGFDVYSVSLDQTRDKWVKAIQDDGLIWESHVSDLKFWNNEAARTYGVQSIPSTLLVDKTGMIIARNLRGPALEAKLKELLGQ